MTRSRSLVVLGLLTACGSSPPSIEPNGTDDGSGSSAGESSTSTDTTGDEDPTSTSSESASESADGSSGADLPVAMDDGFVFTQREAPFTVAAGQGLLTNDTGASEAVVATLETTAGGEVDVAADGSFEYHPPVSFYWGTDSFVYTVTDGSGQQASATAELVVRPTSIRLGELALGYGGLVIDPNGSDANFGRFVESAGDFNGDDRVDVVVLAQNNPMVVWGRAEPGTIDASDDDTKVAFVDFDGEDVSTIGDHDGDGFDDLVLSSLGGGDEPYIVAHLVFGTGDAAAIDRAEIEAGVGGFSIIKDPPFSFDGTEVARSGDQNGDGRDEFAIGGPDPTPAYQGYGAYVVYSRDGAEARSPIVLDDLAANRGYALGRFGGYNAQERRILNDAGDFDGDGLGDVVRVLTAADNQPSGVISFGRAAANAEAPDDVGIRFELQIFQSYGSVVGGGDVNGDGLDDLVCGATDPGDSGRIYVVFGDGGRGETIALGSVGDAQPGFVIVPPTDAPALGLDIAIAGDMNGDGRDDIVVGAVSHGDGDPAVGRVFVVYGRDGATPVLLSDFGDGEQGFVIDGEALGDAPIGTPQGIGRAMASVGDMNGDGRADLVLGAPAVDTLGRVYVVFGQPSGLLD